eukprot:COSAG03_NODE_22469_length_290_cov_2.146597_1_plen_41_part_10
MCVRGVGGWLGTFRHAVLERGTARQGLQGGREGERKRKRET